MMATQIAGVLDAVQKEQRAGHHRRNYQDHYAQLFPQMVQFALQRSYLFLGAL